jgi:hypothetical protein
VTDTRDDLQKCYEEFYIPFCARPVHISNLFMCTCVRSVLEMRYMKHLSAGLISGKEKRNIGLMDFVNIW